MRKSVNFALVIAAVAAGACKQNASVAAAPTECSDAQGTGTAAQTRIERRVLALFSEQLGVKSVTLAADIVDELGADSLDCVELVMALEEEFGIAIPDEDAEKLRTAAQVVTYLCSHKAPSSK